MSNLATLRAGSNRPAPIIPQNLDDVWRLATAIAKSGMAPKGMETPEKLTVAVLQGLEVGMSPMTAVQSIAVFNGRPTIYGDGALGLVRSSGLLEKFKEGVDETDPANPVGWCTVQRFGEEEVTIRFSKADAIEAKLWGKRGASGQDTPWITYPKRMLKMRARSWALRDTFADVFKGLHIREEVEDIPEARDITPPVPPSPPSPPSPPPARVAHVPTSPAVRELVASHPDAPLEVAGPGSDWFESLEEALRQAPDAESIAEVWANMDVEQVCSDPSDRQIAVGIRRRVQPNWTGEED